MFYNMFMQYIMLQKVIPLHLLNPTFEEAMWLFYVDFTSQQNML